MKILNTYNCTLTTSPAPECTATDQNRIRDLEKQESPLGLVYSPPSKSIFRRMKCYMLFLLSFFLLGVTPTFAQQYPVQVNVQVMQPVTPYLPQLLGSIYGGNTNNLARDINDQLRVTLINTGTVGKNVKLSAKIERLSPMPMKIYLNPGYSPPKPVTMAPNQMIAPSKDLLNQAFGYFTKSDVIYENTSPEALKDGLNYKLPEGTYRMCVSAYDYEKMGQSGPLSAPGTGCATFVICYTASAPQLIMPISTMGHSGTDFSVFEPKSSQIQFAWTAPATTCGTPLGFVSYDLEIKKVLPGQSITDAASARNPSVFTEMNIPRNNFILDTLRYPFVFEKGEKYIVRVKANYEAMPDNPVSIANEGYSQIARFVYEPEAGQGRPGGDIVAATDTLPKIETTVKGRLVYQFSDDMESGLYPLAGQPVYIKRVFAKTRKDADGIVHFDRLSQDEVSAMPFYPEMLDGQIATTDENGQFELQLGMTKMDRSGVIKGDDWQYTFAMQYAGNEQILPENINPQIPENLSDLEGQLVRMYQVEVVNPFFKPTDNYIQISPGGERNLNEVVISANSYTLKVNVKEVIEGQDATLLQRGVEQMEGDFVKNATIKLYRLTKNKTNPNLTIPYFEGDLLSLTDWQEEDDKVLLATRTTPNLNAKSDNPEDYRVDFTHLFRSPDGELYDYILRLEDGKGAMNIPINNNKINDPLIPVNSGIWNTMDNLQHGDPNIIDIGNHPNMGPILQGGIPIGPGVLPPVNNGLMLPGNNILPGANNPSLQGESSTFPGDFGRNPGGIPGHGPFVGELDISPDLFNSPQEKMQPSNGDDSTSNSFAKYEDKWVSWSYNDEPGIAYLTLTKELAEPPHSVVTGKLEYKFKGDPSIPAQPYANMPVKLMVFYLMKNGEELQNPSDNDYYSQVVQNYANQDLPEGYQIGSPSDWYQYGEEQKFEDNGKVLQTTMTDAQGNFIFDFENLDNSMQVRSGALLQEFGYDDRGRRQGESIRGDFMRVLRVVPDVNQYTAPDDDIEVQPWGDFDAGTLTTYVRTFNLEVAVQAEEDLLQLNDIPVQLYFNPDANPMYPIPTKPGLDLNKPVEVNGNNYTLIREAMASEKKEETFQNALGEAALGALEAGLGVSVSTIPDKTYQLKTTTFRDLVISQSAADYGRFYYIEAGGASMQREGNITLESDYLAYPRNQISDNWDSDFYGYRSQGGMDDHLTEMTRELEKKILFNSEFEPDRTIRVYLAPKLAQPRIAGRLIDDFTTLGIPTGWGAVKLKVKLTKYGRTTSYTTGEAVETRSEKPYEQEKTYNVATDRYGYFDFKDFTEEFRDRDFVSMEPLELRIDVHGYNDTTIVLPQVMHSGEQLYYDPIILKAGCNGCYGYVADADNHEQGVAARVKVLENGRWVDTYPDEGRSVSKIANPILNSGVMNQMLQNAVNDDVFGTTGGMADYRPQLFQQQKRLVNNQNKELRNWLQEAGNVMANRPSHGPNAGSDFLYPPQEDQDEWKTFGKIQVKTNDRGKIVAAQLTGNVQGDAGTQMWQHYANAFDGNGMTMATSNVQIAGVYSPVKHRFDLPIPTKKFMEGSSGAKGTKIVILPYDRAYIPDTVTVDSYDSENLGTFYLNRRKHKVKVELTTKDPQTGVSKVPAGAIVSIDGVEEEQIVDEEGTAYFEFVNNATKNFTLRIRPQQPESVSEGLQAQMGQVNSLFDADAMADLEMNQESNVAIPVVFVPKTVNFANEDDNQVHTLEIELDPGATVSGKVTFEKDDTPVANAVVYFDKGKGINTDIMTVTNEQGNYTLAGVPIPEPDLNGQLSFDQLKMGASYSDKVHSYVGEVKNVPLADADKSIDFTIKEIDDMDLTHLLGMSVRLTEAEKSRNESYTISGQLLVPGNANFSLGEEIAGNTVSFNNITVTASDLKNSSGIPLAIPEGNKILLDNKSLSVKAFEYYNATVSSGRGTSNLEIVKNESDTSGVLKAAIRIVDNSFNFPSSYMTIANTDFYLGNFGTDDGGVSQENTEESPTMQVMERSNVVGAVGPQKNNVQLSSSVIEKLIVPVFSSEEYAATKFSLSDVYGRGVRFNYLGFEGITGNSGVRESYIEGDSVNLYLGLTAKIQGGIELNFDAGKAILTHNQMKSISNNDTLRIQLEEWDVMSTSWDLSPTSGGIVLREGVLNTGIVGLPFTNMSIIPGDPEGELICNTLDAESLKEAANQGKLVLGGGASELRLADNIDIVFAYDPDVGTTPGEGHYKFSLHSVLGKVAYFGGLDGMTDPSQRFDIQFVSSLSNGDQLFAFDGDMEPVTLYNQLKFTPQRLFNYEDNFSIGGLVSMDIKDVPKNIGMDLRYDYTGNDDIKNELSFGALDFHFMGNGGSKFAVNMNYADAQRIDKEVVALPGRVTLPGSDISFQANFVSIVYEGAKDPIPATGKVGELAYHQNSNPDRYAYRSGGGAQSGAPTKWIDFLKFYDTEMQRLSAEENIDMKTHSEIFIGTSEQLFGDAAKALTGSLSSMGNYGSHTGGTMGDFANEMYNAASQGINDINNHGRQTINGLINQGGAMQQEAMDVIDDVTNQFDKFQGADQDAYNQIYQDVQGQLDGLKGKTGELASQILSKRNEFLTFGDNLYSHIYGAITDPGQEAQLMIEEMYNNLTTAITNEFNEYKIYAEGVYSGVTDKANELQSMGEGIYDQLYHEVSGTINELQSVGNQTKRDVTGIINGYRSYGNQLYAETSGNIGQVISSGTEVLDAMLAETDVLRQQAESSYNDVAAQIADLEAQGKAEYAAIQREILAQLDESRTQADALYNELLAKKNEWEQNGQNLLNEGSGQIVDMEAYGRQMYDSLYNDLVGSASEIQSYVESLQGNVEEQINELRSMGEEIYTEIYNEISGTISEHRRYVDGVYTSSMEALDDYRVYLEGSYDNLNDLVSDAADTFMSHIGEGADGLIQYGEDAYNEFLKEPLGPVIDEMNDLLNTGAQYISMGKQKVDSLMGRWPIAGDVVGAVKDFDVDDMGGSLLKMGGNLVDFDGIKENAKDKLILVANETVDGIKESLAIDNIAVSADGMSADVFKGMHIDFDINRMRFTGSMYSDFISFGAVELSQLGIEVLIEPKGWYLYTGAGIDMPTSAPLNPIIFPIGVGFLVGMYPDISPSLESRVTQHSYVRQLPNSIKSGLKGFFLTGKKDILKPTSVGINFAIVDFEIGASAGLDARLYANFEPVNTTNIGLGVMAFADAYARLSVLGTCGISGSAAANVGIKASYMNSPEGSSLSAAACASVSVAGSAWCGLGPAKISGSFNESIIAMLKLCAGDACREAVTLKLELGGNCLDSNEFDYAN